MLSINTGLVRRFILQARRPCAIAFTGCSIALLPIAGGAAETQHFTSVAHDVKTDHVLFTEQYDVQVDNGRWMSGSTRYVLPSGQQIAERKFDFSADRYVPVFSLDQSTPEYREGISRIDRDKVEVYMMRDGTPQKATLDRVKDMVGDCGSQPYLVDHLDDLQAGKTLHFTLAVAGRVDSYRLRAAKVKDVDLDGHHAIRIRIELDSVVSLVLSPLELTIEPSTKRLLEYSGITNVKDPTTKKSFTARIVFAYK
jgi:hypothetical protein